MSPGSWVGLLSRFSRVRLCATLWIAAHQAPLSLEFSRQEHWSGWPFPSPMHACMPSRFSCVRLCVTLWTAALQAPLSLGFSRREHCSGLPFPPPLNRAEASPERAQRFCPSVPRKPVLPWSSLSCPQPLLVGFSCWLCSPGWTLTETRQDSSLVLLQPPQAPRSEAPASLNPLCPPSGLW